jgi:hypothetical protein
MKPYPRWIFALIGVLALASTGWAGQCLSPSPTTLAGGKSYAPIQDRELTAGELGTLQALFKSIDGEWRGSSDTFFCKSISDPDDVEPARLTIKARARVDRNGNLEMTAELYNPQERTGYQQILRLFLNDNRLRIDHDTGAGDVELIEINDRKVAFLYRRTTPTGTSGASNRSEYFFTLLAGEKSLTIEQLIYVQAKLSSGYTWQLHR